MKEKMKDEIIIETVVLRYKRLVNLKDYNNAEATFHSQTSLDLKDQLDGYEKMRETANQWELQELENRVKMNQKRQDRELELTKERHKQEQKEFNEFLKEVFDFIKANPKAPQRSIAVALDRTTYEVSNALATLSQEGLISKQECNDRGFEVSDDVTFYKELELDNDNSNDDEDPEVY